MAVTTRVEADSAFPVIEKVQFTPSTGVTVTSNSSYRIGNLVIFNMSFTRTGASITTLGYLAEKFRPSDTVQFGLATGEGSWAIGGGGNVVVGTTITVTSNIRLNGVYIVE